MSGLLRCVAAACVLLSLSSLSPVRGMSVFTPVPAYTGPAPWSPRWASAAWVANSSIFVWGGASSETPLGEVWTTANGGAAWKQVSAPQASTGGDQPMLGGLGLYFKGQNWVFSGQPSTASACKDSAAVWTSTPGGAWTQQTNNAAFWQRAGAAAAVWTPPISSGQPEQIVVLGGTLCNSGTFNDVWYTTGSGQWLQHTDKAQFPQFIGAGLATIHSGSQLILAGGGVQGSPLTSQVWLGGWEDAKGTLTWWKVTDNAPFGPRFANLVSTSNDYLYLIQGGGLRLDKQLAPSNDVWTSADGGYSWRALSVADAFPARAGASLVALGRQVFIFGGAASPRTFYNDVWQAWLN